jgi:hypothetical protein
MVHLEDMHQLGLSHEDCWLIPNKQQQQKRKDLSQDVIKREPALEDSIILDQNFGHFLMDSTKFDQMPSTHEEEELGQAKRKEYMEIIHGLHSELCDLRHIFLKKREYLRYLGVVNDLGLLLFNGGQPLALLVS